MQSQPRSSWSIKMNRYSTSTESDATPFKSCLIRANQSPCSIYSRTMPQHGHTCEKNSDVRRAETLSRQHLGQSMPPSSTPPVTRWPPQWERRNHTTDRRYKLAPDGFTISGSIWRGETRERIGSALSLETRLTKAVSKTSSSSRRNQAALGLSPQESGMS